MKFFVTGASGYIGGSVATRLIASGHAVVGLTRTAEKSEKLQAQGIEPLVAELDDAEALTRAARTADAVINAASADHPGAVETLLQALSRSGKLFIHTSGSAIVADDACGEAGEQAYSEDDYFEPVPFRLERVEMNRRVRVAAIEDGVRGVVICPPTIYGEGLGLEKDSDQIPKLMSLSERQGAGLYLGRGLNRYSNVHIRDLVDLFELVIDKAPGGAFFFAENGEMSFREIAEHIARALGLPGVHSLDVEEVTRSFGPAARYGLASNSRVRAVAARRLGWRPSAPALSDWFEALARQRAAANAA
ncbi:MAG: NAD-dependent epimerase/dehydratase family protein [Proteobacteria bacterium]|nr:NAD-dependent epimerase/dehydratase family protein [Pseudomonadota bacterium]